MDVTRWCGELTLTPLLRHAAEVLRAAIPRRGDIPADGAEALNITRTFGMFNAESSRVELPEIDPDEGMTYQPFALTPELRRAAELLLVYLAYQVGLIEQAYPVPDAEEMRVFAEAAVQGSEVPAGRLAAMDELAEDVAKKLKLRFEITDESNGELTVYT